MSLPDSECTVSGLIRSKAARDPERVFIVKDAVQLTFGEAERRSRKLARGLLATGRRQGHARRDPAAERARLGARVARRCAHRRARRAAQHLLPGARARLRAASRRRAHAAHDGALPEQRLPRAAREVRARAHRARRSAAAAAHAAVSARGPDLGERRPRAPVDRRRRSRARSARRGDTGARRRAARAGGARGPARRPARGDLQLGLDRRAQGRDPHARHRAAPRAQPERLPRPDAPTTASTRRCRSSGSAASASR